MQKLTKCASGLLIFTALALPILALAQADMEGAEGNCNDEMSEGAGCGAAGSGSTSAQSTYSAPSAYSYSAPSSYSYASQPYPTSPYTPAYTGIAPSYQTYAPSYGDSSGTTGSSYAQPYSYATSYPSSAGNNYSSYSPNSYASATPTYGNTYQFSNQQYLTAPPQTTSIPTGTYSWGNQLCYWSDYQGLALCGSDPQQWVYDPYSGTWY